MKKGKLLIIDDNEDILFALNLLLEPYMEQIRVATQPERIQRDGMKALNGQTAQKCFGGRDERHGKNKGVGSRSQAVGRLVPWSNKSVCVSWAGRFQKSGIVSAEALLKYAD